MLKRLISAAVALTMALTLTASLLGADAGTGVVESTETVTGSFSCSFVDNDYDTNLTGVSGIGTKNTWGMDFPVIDELIERVTTLDRLKSIVLRVTASNTQPCWNGTTPKLELHWNSRDNNENMQTAEFSNGVATISATVPSGVTDIVLNPYAFSSSVGTVTFSVEVEIVYEMEQLEPAEGICGLNGDNVRWRLSEDGTLTLYGEGATNNYSMRSSPFEDLEVKRIVVSEGVTTIGSYLFCWSGALSAQLPESVTKIEEGAFMYCWDLGSVSLGSSVTMINKSAFRYCSSLTSINLPDTLTNIGAYAFDRCIKLQTVTIPGGVKIIGTEAFKNCYELKSVVISEGVGELGSGCFASCSELVSVSLPDSLYYIAKSAFEHCGKLVLSSLPEGVTSIGQNAFNCCYAITELELPSSVKTLNYRVLANCTGLTKLVVPASVTSINENAFDFTTGVTLHVYSGSYALDWAKSHSVSYYLIDPPAGDSNRDGVVDSSELERILMHILGLSLISQPDGDPADGNRDVSIDIRDFNLAYYEMTRG